MTQKPSSHPQGNDVLKDDELLCTAVSRAVFKADF